MPEHLELQHLVDGDGDCEAASRHRKSSISRCRSCPYLGLMLAALSSLFFSLCSVIVKGLVEVNPMELAAFRFVGVLLPAIPIVIYKGEHPFPKGRRMMLLLRSFVGTTGLMLSFYAFRHMPLADASVVVFSVPVFVAIFARIFLKEPCGIFNVITVCLTLIGVVLITRPPLIFGNTVESLTDNHVETEHADLWGAVAAFSATLFGANAYVLLRALKGLHFSVIMSNFGSFALIQTIVVTWAIGALCMPRCGTDRLLVVALALFSFGGQILLTLALQMEQAGPVAIARSADIVFAFFWQVLFFNEIPNRYSVGGAILVTSSVLLTGLRKWAVSLPETSNIKKSLGVLAI
ncbi:solute carrier family 35 member G1 [Athalia rosae]|uniref:solute carrier family 35 member G1 n=1 Tax=Athalia rosae TaxID=37344 RepID=UPI0006266231|nr:solute carrier family 35 member G1 [Athalia rosae]XP_048505980.1 solute carrier family 35 member G1 [Athalia rosae]XP_048505981.1 solute carrier family 35 member G1 [Athalia rosae]XP_048505982.1 solute carrier family 35 member G1 [Athalia rosae]XP_048505983.1 solute carrier family 35 member G1 [Athalia rosae]